MRSVRNTHRTAMKRMLFVWKNRSSATRNKERKPSPAEAERLLIAPVDSHNMDIWSLNDVRLGEQRLVIERVLRQKGNNNAV